MIDLADVAQEALTARLHQVDPNQVLEWAAAALAFSQDGQAQAGLLETRSLDSAWTANWHTENAVAAQFILELAARHVPRGKLASASTTQLEAIAVLAHQLWRLRLAEDRIAAGLAIPRSVRLQRDGTFAVFSADKPPFRVNDYQRVYLERIATSSPSRAQGDVALAQRLIASVESGQPLADEFEDINAALRLARGHGLLELLGVLVILTKWAGGRDQDIAGRRSTRPALERSLNATFGAWYPTLRKEEVDAALHHLVMTQEVLQTSTIAIHDHREAHARLYSRPILELPDSTLFVPRTAPHFAWTVLFSRLLEGTWPERLSPSDGALVAALERRRQHMRPILGLENDLKTVLAESGLPHVVGVTQTGRRRSLLGVPITRGEIDAVVLDHERRTIWVIEAKDLAMPFAARRIRSELDKYYRPNGFREKLRAKCDELASGTSEVVEALAPGCSPDGYMVRGMFVTRDITPASCHDDPGHQFVVLDELESFLHLQNRSAVDTGRVPDSP